MKLHSPSNITLPALKIQKRNARKTMEDDETVKSLIISNLLLDQEFNKLYLGTLKKSRELLRIIQLNEEQLYNEYGVRSIKKLGLRELVIIKRAILLKKKDKRISKKNKKEPDELNKVIIKMIKETYKYAQKDIIKLSNEMQNSVSAFEAKRKKEISILSSTTIYVCKKCAKIIYTGRFSRHTCSCGEKITRIAQTKQIPIQHFNNKLINFIELNYWFEHGVDYLLRRKNLQTLVGYNVLGHSGVWHEIDNIAESKSENYRFFCECKNSKVIVKDIFVFSGKMIDVGINRGYVFTTSNELSDEIFRLARSKNIDIVKGVLIRDTTTLLKDIKEGKD